MFRHVFLTRLDTIVLDTFTFFIHHFLPEPLSGLAGNIFCFLVVSFVSFLVGLIVHFCVCFLDVLCRFSGSELPQAQDSAVVRSSCAERIAVRIYKYSTLFWKADFVIIALALGSGHT